MNQSSDHPAASALPVDVVLCMCFVCLVLQAVLDGEDAVQQWLDYDGVPTQQVCDTRHAVVVRSEPATLPSSLCVTQSCIRHLEACR